MEGVVMNYTVAKITQDCDFDTVQVPKLVIQLDADGQNVVDPVTGQPVWIPATMQTDLNVVGVTESKYMMRWLDATGAQITEAAYQAAIASGSSGVYRAAFVGCTYHCG